MLSFLRQFDFQAFLSAFLVLFAAIDAVGSIPVILKAKSMGRIVNPKTGAIYSTLMMFGFFYIGEAFLSLFGLDISTFAIGGSVIIFLFGLEIFKSSDAESGRDVTLIPITFPLLTGAGVLTTLLTIRAQFGDLNVLLAAVCNVFIIWFVMRFVEKIEQILGRSIIYMLQKLFGIILLAIAFKVFITNVTLVVEKAGM